MLERSKPVNDFCAIDVETANNHIGSICQIGIAHFHNGSVVESWSVLVNPESLFANHNIMIHGITPMMVTGKPIFADLYPELHDHIHGNILVSHTMFDRSAVNSALGQSKLPAIPATWVDSCKLAKKAWPGRRKHGGYGLKSLAEFRGISFRHHDALEDAITAGKITVAACAALHMSISQYAGCP